MNCNLTAVNSGHSDKSPIHDTSQTCILEGSKAFPLYHQRKRGKECLSEQFLRGGGPPDGDRHLGTGCPAKRLHSTLLMRGKVLGHPCQRPWRPGTFNDTERKIPDSLSPPHTPKEQSTDKKQDPKSQ